MTLSGRLFTIVIITQWEKQVELAKQAIWKFLSGYRWDIEYAKDSRISGVAYWKIQKQGFETELNHKETRDKR